MSKETLYKIQIILIVLLVITVINWLLKGFTGLDYVEDITSRIGFSGHTKYFIYAGINIVAIIVSIMCLRC